MLGFLRRYRERRRLRRLAIDADARLLIAEHGPIAYYEARALTREKTPPGQSRHPHWNAVAVRIGELTD
ncbi:MAG: hypothetical protein WAP03_29920 [Methylorubrum rhodinum]|uniref:hypothetical protein n=1 Tax=Methylorubrum rhodinum TaxID=29428 RepID=UPI003BAE2344